MTPIEALATVKAKKTDGEQLYLCSMGYQRHFILPHKAALQLLEALSQAEEFDGGWKEEQIRPLDREFVTLQPFSREKYYHIKAANLLKIPFGKYEEQLEQMTAQG